MTSRLERCVVWCCLPCAQIVLFLLTAFVAQSGESGLLKAAEDPPSAAPAASAQVACQVLADEALAGPLRTITAEYTRRTGTPIALRLLPADQLNRWIEAKQAAGDVVLCLAPRDEKTPVSSLPEAKTVAWKHPSGEPVWGAVIGGHAAAPDVVRFVGGPTGLTEEMGITSRALEAHYLAGGNVPLVIRALIAAQKAKIIQLSFREATAIDLAGRNVLEAVQTSVYPKVIDCPPKSSGRTSLDAMAKNGIQLKVRARVTVRANLQQLIGGATEETIIARVGEGIVSAIGSAETHAHVLENPDMISKTVLARKLDSQTAFKIVSIDIADIDVGENIGARLQADQAEADTRVARAQAEGRRAAAVAREQEMLAAIEESRAKVVDAEAEVPRAMSEAFRSAKLSVLDYFKLRNVQADTEMRKSIATSATAGGRPS